jgi:two-component system CheB/CheR fusion protein
MGKYADLLQREPAEFQALLKDMLIGVTNFFRDRESFEALERDVLPAILKQKTAGQQVRAWVAACSTGQEAYSLAMLLVEEAERHERAPEIQVFASDIDEQAIAVARSGAYSSAIVTDVPPARLRQFFTKEPGRYCIRKAIRDRVLFSAHNVLRDPPFSRLDLISCRNLLIYLNRDMQMRVLEMFHSALHPNGFLFLGSSESAEAAAEFFMPFDKKHRLYRARVLSRPVGYVPLLPRTSLAASPVLQLSSGGTALTRQFSYIDVHHRALARYGPPSVVVDRDLNVVHVSEFAGRFLRYIAGELSRSLIASVLPELRLELRTALYQVQQGLGRYETPAIAVRRGDDTFSVRIAVQRFHDSVASADFMLIFFDETVVAPVDGIASDAAPRSDLIVMQLENELQRTKERLQETIEHAEISFEELRSSNEELQSINEELRSATEELETSKEELQSVNEELITVNHELKMKVEETGKANDDLNNLIASTDIATIFVDRGMRIKRFTPRAADIFNIIPSDIGRPLLDITHRLDYDQLTDDVSATFDTLRVVERELRSKDGRHYIARLLPYRTTEDRIDGAAMTFFDISGRREAEAKVRTGEEWMRLVAESTGDYAIVTADEQGSITGWNKGAELSFGYREAEILGRPIDTIFTPEDRAQGIPADEMRRARLAGRVEDQRWHVRKDGTTFFCQGVMTPLDNGKVLGYAKIVRDFTHQAMRERQREEAFGNERHNRSMAENASAMKDEFLAVMSHELRHPLNLIAITAEMLSRQSEVSGKPSTMRAVALIRDAVSSQAKIISDLLDISRLSTGKLSLACHPTDLRAAVARWVDALRADPIVARIELACLLPDAPVPVCIDEIRMEQVVLNLLHNAIKFTPAGGRVEISLAKVEGFIRLDVTDTGAGIAAQHLPRIFDMYAQGGGTAQHSASGLGIGLALVRQIVELHGGRAEAASEGLGLGSRFTIRLPLDGSAGPEPCAVLAVPGNPLAGRRVLLVDDMEDALYLFKELLELDGAVVSVATSARQGLQLLGSEGFDLVLSDISMPEMDGYAFMRAVRAQPALRAIPAIAASGLGQEADMRRALEAGFSDYITKPVAIDVLRAKARKLLASAGRSASKYTPARHWKGVDWTSRCVGMPVPGSLYIITARARRAASFRAIAPPQAGFHAVQCNAVQGRTRPPLTGAYHEQGRMWADAGGRGRRLVPVAPPDGGRRRRPVRRCRRSRHGAGQGPCRRALAAGSGARPCPPTFRPEVP